MVKLQKSFKPFQPQNSTWMYLLIALVFALATLVAYLLLQLTRSGASDRKIQLFQTTDFIRDITSSNICGGACDSNTINVTNPNIFNDPYIPPLNTSELNLNIPRNGVQGLVPVNIQSRGGFQGNFTQVGILTRDNDNAPTILPLMGRRVMNGRDKLQYYTISNTGSVNTKLPVRKNNRSCGGEYGCDEITNGDAVYVEGYNGLFNATVYETATYAYIPI